MPAVTEQITRSGDDLKYLTLMQTVQVSIFAVILDDHCITGEDFQSRADHRQTQRSMSALTVAIWGRTQLRRRIPRMGMRYETVTVRKSITLNRPELYTPSVGQLNLTCCGGHPCQYVPMAEAERCSLAMINAGVSIPEVDALVRSLDQHAYQADRSVDYSISVGIRGNAFL